jgi:hypothetical protein
MSVTCSMRCAAIAVLWLLAILWGQAAAAPPPDAAEVLEVKVLEAQVDQGQGEPFDVRYRMEVLSVLRLTIPAQKVARALDWVRLGPAAAAPARRR